MPLLLVDNHDSFTWNLVELLRNCCKCNVIILPNEEVNPSMIRDYDGIIFSPGPGLPSERQEMFSVIAEVERLSREGIKNISILGICLGLQAIAMYYGATLINLSDVIHGQSRKMQILDHSSILLKRLEDGTEAGLYHSWAVGNTSLPPCLGVTCVSEDGIIMALEHKTLPVYGLQFHPESIMTPSGSVIIMNWLEIIRTIS